MLTFVLRRTLATFLVLLAASFVVYLLTAYSGNPLADLIGSRDPNREELIAERIRELNLETPVPLRYFSWLAGVGGCFIGQCDLGQSYVTNQEVTAALAAAVPATLSLVTAATFIAIILGIAYYVLLNRTRFGFDLRATGMNPFAARASGLLSNSSSLENNDGRRRSPVSAASDSASGAHPA